MRFQSDVSSFLFFMSHHAVWSAGILYNASDIFLIFVCPLFIAVFDCLFWPLSENIFYIFQVFLVFSSLSLSLKPTPVLLSPQFSAPLLAFFSDTSITQCHYEMKLWFLKQLQWIKHLDSFLVSFFPLSVTSTMAALNKYEATVARLLWATAQTLQKTTSGLVYTWISTLFFRKKISTYWFIHVLFYTGKGKSFAGISIRQIKCNSS